MDFLHLEVIPQQLPQTVVHRSCRSESLAAGGCAVNAVPERHFQRTYATLQSFDALTLDTTPTTRLAHPCGTI